MVKMTILFLLWQRGLGTIEEPALESDKRTCLSVWLKLLEQLNTQNGKQSVGYPIWLPRLQTAKETVVTFGSMCVRVEISVCIILNGFITCELHYGMIWSSLFSTATLNRFQSGFKSV